MNSQPPASKQFFPPNAHLHPRRDELRESRKTAIFTRVTCVGSETCDFFYSHLTATARSLRHQPLCQVPTS